MPTVPTPTDSDRVAKAQPLVQQLMDQLPAIHGLLAEWRHTLDQVGYLVNALGPDITPDEWDELAEEAGWNKVSFEADVLIAMVCPVPTDHTGGMWAKHHEWDVLAAMWERCAHAAPDMRMSGGHAELVKRVEHLEFNQQELLERAAIWGDEETVIDRWRTLEGKEREAVFDLLTYLAERQAS